MIPYGSIIKLITLKNKRYIKKLEDDFIFNSSEGILQGFTIHNSDFGDIIRTHLNNPVLIEQASLMDILMSIKRKTQIIYPKDLAYICLRLGAGPNREIGEAGCGSGALTLALSWFCGDSGKIYSQDAREEFVHLARRNLEWSNLGGNVCLEHKNIENGFLQNHLDAIFIDMREPWLYMEQILTAIKPGGILGFLLPTVNQVNELLLKLEKLPVGNVEVEEIFIRQWKAIPDRLRPKDRMTAHTGFLIFCKQQKQNFLFLHENLDTRERKQEDAWRARNLE